MVTTALTFVAAASAAAGMLLALPGSLVRGARNPDQRAGRGLRLLAALGNRVRPGRAPADLRGRIEAAGRPAGLGVREVMAAKVAAALLGGIAAVPLAALAPGRLGIVIAPLAPAAGFLGPDLLARAAGGRAGPARAP